MMVDGEGVLNQNQEKMKEIKKNIKKMVGLEEVKLLIKKIMKKMMVGTEEVKQNLRKNIKKIFGVKEV